MIAEERQGVAVTSPATTDDGLKLDGTFGACFTTSSTTLFAAGRAADVGALHADAAGQGVGGVAFCKAFDLFVPPGTAPQTYEIVVDPYAANGDAGSSCP